MLGNLHLEGPLHHKFEMFNVGCTGLADFEPCRGNVYFTQRILFRPSLYSPNDFLKTQGSCKHLYIRSIRILTCLLGEFAVTKVSRCEMFGIFKVKCRYSFRKMLNAAGTFFWLKIFAPFVSNYP